MLVGLVEPPADRDDLPSPRSTGHESPVTEGFGALPVIEHEVIAFGSDFAVAKP
jgi:hypothetical protein